MTVRVIDVATTIVRKFTIMILSIEFVHITKGILNYPFPSSLLRAIWIFTIFFYGQGRKMNWEQRLITIAMAGYEQAMLFYLPVTSSNHLQWRCAIVTWARLSGAHQRFLDINLFTSAASATPIRFLVDRI